MINWTAIRQSLIGDRSESVLPMRIKLPALPLAVMEFTQRADDPDASTEELARLIETDSALTCDLLRYVNSSSTGLSHRVRCIQQAIAILGIHSCKLYLQTTAIKRSMKDLECRLMDLEKFWTSNLERALFAREVAVLLNADHDLAFAGGMLQDFLLPVITNELDDEYRDYLDDPSEQKHGFVEFEQNSFGWDHAHAAANVMFAWEFPDNLICCVLLHHKGLKLLNDQRLKNSAAAAVAISALLPDPLNQEIDGLRDLFQWNETVPEYDLLAIAERVDQRFSEMSPINVNHAPLLERIRSADLLVH